VVVAAVLDMSLYLIPVVLGVRVVVVRDNRRQLELLELQIQAVAVAVADITLLAQLIMLAATAAQASSSFPMLAHKNLVAVSSPLLVVTPFTHLQLLALLFQLHLCLHPIWLLLVVQAAALSLVVAAALVAIAQAQQQLTPTQFIL
jgi:hypothetical protein